MFNFLRAPGDRLIIEDGHVYCPIRRRDTEIDLCAACPRIRKIDQAGSQPYVRCRIELPVRPSMYWA